MEKRGQFGETVFMLVVFVCVLAVFLFIFTWESFIPEKDSQQQDSQSNAPLVDQSANTQTTQSSQNPTQPISELDEYSDSSSDEFYNGGEDVILPTQSPEPSPFPPSNIQSGFECTEDFECVPISCCHANACAPQSAAPICEGVYCTQECVPGTLDCGQAYCACINNKCSSISQ